MTARHEKTMGRWYAATRHATLSLARVRSISPSEAETDAAREVVRLLTEDGLDDAYSAIGLDPLDGDPYGRANAYAFLRGRSPKTVVLMGHLDTVGTGDYGPLEPLALDPEALAQQHEALTRMAPGVREDLARSPDDWMFGRGVADMKSGDAANIALLRAFAEATRAGSPPPLSLVLLAVLDEENESAGVLQGVRFLDTLRARHSLEYVGAINTDYTTDEYPGDPHRYIYMGTIGKLLPSFFVVGASSHAGAPFDGLDANLLAAELIRDLSMRMDLCDMAGGQMTPPAVTLRATDLKDHYDTQLPFAAYFYLNVLTLTTTPGELLERLRLHTEASLARTLSRIDETEHVWMSAAGVEWRMPPHRPRAGSVLTYAELLAETSARLGAEHVRAALDEEWDRWPPETDKRERCLWLIQRLWSLSGRQGPAVVLSYAPPYYPHVGPRRSRLSQAVAAVVEAHPELQLVKRDYFPLLSDLSYLSLAPDLDLAALGANMPVWQEPEMRTRPGGYSLPLEAMRALDLPAVDIGPYGRAAHQIGERILMSFTFETLPQLIYETLAELARLEGVGESLTP